MIYSKSEVNRKLLAKQEQTQTTSTLTRAAEELRLGKILSMPRLFGKNTLTEKLKNG